MRKRSLSILVDGNNLLYHAYQNSPSLVCNGEPVGAIVGFFSHLHKLTSRFRPQYFGVIFDSPNGRNTRLQSNSKYKISRRATPVDLKPQFNLCQQILQEVQIKCLRESGVEADDLIASYTRLFAQHENDVVIVSNDNDFLQLVHHSKTCPSGKPMDMGPEVKVLKIKTHRFFNRSRITSNYGVSPHLLSDFRVLTETSDKYTGVLPIEPSQAIELLNRFGSLSMILQNLNEVECQETRKQLKISISHLEIGFRMLKLNDKLPLKDDILDFTSPILPIAESMVAKYVGEDGRNIFSDNKLFEF